MKVLITGGSGFLGRFTARTLKKAGYDVTVLCRGHYSFLSDEGFGVIRGDICDRAFLLDVLKGFDEVHHMASLTGISVNRQLFYRINVEGTRNVIDACLHNGIGRLIYTSSPSVVFDGKSESLVDESRPYPQTFLNPYSETKATAEKMVLDQSRKGNLLTVSLRPHLIWGPEDTNLIPRLLDRARKGRLFMVGHGQNHADLTYVENAALAQLLASRALARGAPVNGRAYFITNDEPVLLWDFISRILEGAGIRKNRRHLSFNLAYGLGAVLENIHALLHLSGEPVMTRFLASQLAMTHTYSVSRAKRDLGYAPVITLDQGLERLLAGLKV